LPTYTSPLAFYKKQKRALEESVGRTPKQLWRQIPEGAFRDFKELTSGGVSSRQLAAMGHPYARVGNGARRGPSKAYVKGAAPLLPINKQSSRLNSSVRLYHRSTRYTLEESVGFDAAKAGRSINAVAPKGTRYVVPRGIWGEIRTRGMARQKAFQDVFFKSQRQAFSNP
jgi:hypothetical protein